MARYNILGIGKRGFSLSKYFQKYPQYSTWNIDTVRRNKEKHYFMLKKQKNIIEYENNVPILTNFLRGIKDKLLVLIDGSEDITGSTLKILEQVKDKCKISIFYICPDSWLLNELKEKQHEIVYNVFQQYARSDVFEQMFIINSSFDDVYIKEEMKYEHIVYCYHMLNVFKNIESIEDNFEEPYETARLVSFGYQSFDEEQEKKLFFNLDNLREKRYYFAMSEKTLNGDGSFYKRIREIVKEQKAKDKEVRIGYGIYKMQQEQDFIFIEERSSDIQK